MSSRHTWFWLVLALGLFCFIFFYQRFQRNIVPVPTPVLAGFNPDKVTRLQVRPMDQLEIRVERTNGAWTLTAPIEYPAQSVSIENLLSVLDRMIPASRITAAELQNRPKADLEYGFANAQASIVLFEGENRLAHVLIGSRTAPGDQVFVQVVGVDGVFVVDADLLGYVPRSANDWRDTTLLNLKALAFDRIVVTNSGKNFELHRASSNDLWRMTWPIQTRADHARIEESIEQLQGVRIRQFVNDNPKSDPEAYGLQPPDLELVFAQGTNVLAHLQFGKSPTNDSQQVFARRVGKPSVVTVSKDLLAPWRVPVNDFRDPHLAAIVGVVGQIEIRGSNTFQLLFQTNQTWRIQPQNWPADNDLVPRLLGAVGGLRVVQFVKDVVTEQDLPAYGLADPSREFVIRSVSATTNGLATNVLAEIQFGTNYQDKVYARRADESFVYAVKLEDFLGLPDSPWQLRDRQILKSSESEVARAIIRQGGKVRQINRNGPHDWALAPGSQGMINDLAVEETVKALCQLKAEEWVAVGAEHRAAFGFSTNALSLTLEFKNGEKATVEFGGETPSMIPLAGTTLDNQWWVFTFPLLVFRDVQSYLSIPANVP
jgi:hypothetical protein